MDPQEQHFVPDRSDDSSGAVPLEIMWRGDEPENVIVPSGWSAELKPPELLAAVRDLVNAHHGGPAGPDWRFTLSLANVALEDLAEFNAQLADAMAEEDARSNPVQVCTTLHFRAVWADGVLLELDGDDEWPRLPLTRLGKDLAAAIATPENRATTTVARDRLLAFMKGGS